MTPLEGPGLPLLPPHERFEIAAPVDKTGDPAEASPFGELFGQAIARANTQIHAAEAAGEAFAAGQNDDIHGTMIALSKADIELRLVGNMRNKIVDAFYELWRMQV
jgi:flagellar hook-basal body complex protein FliE